MTTNTKTRKTNTTPRARAQTELEKHKGSVTRWGDAVEAARAGLARLESESGEALTNAPERLDELANELATARERVDLATSALDSAIEAEHAARLALVAAAADEVTPVVEAAQRRLDEHEKRTAELLAALEDHAGGQWRALTLTDVLPAAGVGSAEDVVFRPLKSGALTADLNAAMLRRDMLALAAQGGDVAAAWPAVEVAEWPAELRPGGVLPPAPRLGTYEKMMQETETGMPARESKARAARSRVHALRDRLAEAEQAEANVQVADLKDKLGTAERDLAEVEQARDNAASSLAAYHARREARDRAIAAADLAWNELVQRVMSR